MSWCSAVQRPVRMQVRWLQGLVALLAGVTLAGLPAPPAVAAAPVQAALAAATTCTASTGPYQRDLETFLGLPVDGVNSTSDCLAIRRFQRIFDIRPAAGYAGPLSYSVITRHRSARVRAAYCPRLDRVVCVDLTAQMMWISQNGTRVWGPYPARSGRDGFETRNTVNRGGDCRSRTSVGTADYCTVFYQDIDHISSEGASMPYSKFFDYGEAFHISDRYIYDELGSHGCIHMLPSQAPYLWQVMPIGTKIAVYGRKPGT